MKHSLILGCLAFTVAQPVFAGRARRRHTRIVVQPKKETREQIIQTTSVQQAIPQVPVLPQKNARVPFRSDLKRAAAYAQHDGDAQALDAGVWEPKMVPVAQRALETEAAAHAHEKLVTEAHATLGESLKQEAQKKRLAQSISARLHNKTSVGVISRAALLQKITDIITAIALLKNDTQPQQKTIDAKQAELGSILAMLYERAYRKGTTKKLTEKIISVLPPSTNLSTLEFLQSKTDAILTELKAQRRKKITEDPTSAGAYIAANAALAASKTRGVLSYFFSRS